MTNSRKLLFRFEKNFHVSPFMSMQHTYDWKFTAPDSTPGSGLMAQTTLLEPDSGKVFFDAKLVLKRCVYVCMPARSSTMLTRRRNPCLGLVLSVFNSSSVLIPVSIGTFFAKNLPWWFSRVRRACSRGVLLLLNVQCTPKGTSDDVP